MSDDESSDDEQMKALMAKVRQEEGAGGAGDEAGDGDDKPKKKMKKKTKKKKKEKDKGDAGEGGGEDVAEKKDKKKKKKSSKDKDKEKKGKSKEQSTEHDAPSKSKKKSKEKTKKDKKEKKKKIKDDSSKDNEPEAIKPPAPVVLDPIDYVDDDDGNASETSDDRKMKELLQQWDEDGDEDSSSSSSSSDDEDNAEGEGFEVRRMTKTELGLEDNALDHIVLAAPDFHEAMKEFEAMTGIKPSAGGSLKGLGTLTARVGLDNQAFIEIITPDPKKAGPIGAQLMELEEGSLVPIHFAIRQTDLSDLADDYVPNELGYDPDRIAMFRAGPDGAPRKWEMLFMHGHFHGGVVPYFVDWGECEHPIGSIAQVGSLKGLTVSCPAGSRVHELLKGIKDVTVVDGELGLEFSFGSPEGTITFSGDNPPGLKFPGYEEKNAQVLPASDVEGSYSNEDDGQDSEESSASEGSDDDDENDETEAIDETEVNDDSDAVDETEANDKDSASNEGDDSDEPEEESEEAEASEVEAVEEDEEAETSEVEAAEEDEEAAAGEAENDDDNEEGEEEEEDEEDWSKASDDEVESQES